MATLQTQKKEGLLSDIGLEEAGVDAIATHLNRYLSDLHVYYGKLHNYHWNVEGTDFFILHEVLQEEYEAIAEEIDDVAERILKIGRRPMTRLADYVAHSGLEESESRGYGGHEVAESVAHDLETMIGGLRETIKVAQEHGDEGTADDAIESLKAREKRLWMFNAYKR